MITAHNDIQLFDSLSKAYLGDSIPIRAYTIRAVDLLGAMGMPGELADSSLCKYKYIRVYLGYRRNVGFKLYIVPVQDANLAQLKGGIDIMLNSEGKGLPFNKPKTGFYNEEEYVLDLNAPCPNTCATDPSPLTATVSKKP